MAERSNKQDGQHILTTPSFGHPLLNKISLSSLPESPTLKLEVVQQLLESAQHHSLLDHRRIARGLLFKASYISENMDSGLHPLHGEVTLALANNLLIDSYVNRASKLLEISRIVFTELDHTNSSLGIRLACTEQRLTDYGNIKRPKVHSNSNLRTKEINFLIENFESILQVANNPEISEYSRIATFQSLSRITSCYELIGDNSASLSFSYLLADLAPKIFGADHLLSASMYYQLSSSCSNSGYKHFAVGHSASKRCQSVLSERDLKHSSLYWNSLRTESEILVALNREEEALMTQDYARFISDSMFESPENSEIDPFEYTFFLDECCRTAFEQGRLETAEEISDKLHDFKKPRIVGWVMRDANYEEQRAAIKCAIGKRDQAIEILNDTQQLLANNGLAYSNDRLNLLYGIFSMAKESLKFDLMEDAAHTLVNTSDMIYPHPDNFSRGYSRLHLIEAQAANGHYIEAISNSLIAAPILSSSLYEHITPIDYTYFVHCLGHALIHIGDYKLATEWLTQGVNLLQESGLADEILPESPTEEDEDQRYAYNKILQAIILQSGCYTGLAAICARTGNQSGFNYYKDCFNESISKVAYNESNTTNFENRFSTILLAEECNLHLQSNALDKAISNYNKAIQHLDTLTKETDKIFKLKILSTMPTYAMGLHSIDERIDLLDQTLSALEDAESFSYEMVTILRELSELFKEKNLIERSYHASEHADIIEANLAELSRPDCPILPDPPEYELDQSDE